MTTKKATTTQDVLCVLAIIAYGLALLGLNALHTAITRLLHGG